MAVQGMKESMVRANSLDYNAVNQITDWVQTRVMNSADRKEGAKAFTEKRTGRMARAIALRHPRSESV